MTDLYQPDARGRLARGGPPGPAGAVPANWWFRPEPAAAPAGAVPAGRLGRWPVGWRAVGLWLTAYVLLTAVWSGLGRLVVATSGSPPRELAVNQWFEARRTPTLDAATSWISRSADAGPKLILIALLCALFVALWRRLDEAVFLVAVMSVEVTSFVTTTALVRRGRPDVVRLDGSLPTSSFPSGHVAATTALYLSLACIVWWHARRPLRAAVFTALAMTWMVVVALARLYRGMHYLSDVTAGAFLGLASIALGYAVLQAGRRARARRLAVSADVARHRPALPDHGPLADRPHHRPLDERGWPPQPPGAPLPGRYDGRVAG